MPAVDTFPIVHRIQIDELPAHLSMIEAELEGVHRIELLRGKTVVAELTKPKRSSRNDVLNPSERPDFAARLKSMWGDRVFEDSTPSIRADRDAGY